MRRREFIVGLGGALALPGAVRAQQSALPVIGLIHPGSPEAFAGRMAAFRKGLNEVGFFEGRNVAIEYRWANNDSSRVPEMAADLVSRRVTVIATPGTSGVVGVVKAATTTIPIVFSTGADPVQLGYVASLNRPGGNITGINDMNASLTSKRLEMLSELLPKAKRFALLINPTSPEAESVRTEIEAAAIASGLQIDVVWAATGPEIDAAFASVEEMHTEALLVHTNPLFNVRRTQLVILAAGHRLPTIYPWREAPEIGGLMFYGTSGTDEYRQVGIYVGRILKGEKPADLPVMRPTKFELVVNLRTARALGIEVPQRLLALADEVIE